MIAHKYAAIINENFRPLFLEVRVHFYRLLQSDRLRWNKGIHSFFMVSAGRWRQERIRVNQNDRRQGHPWVYDSLCPSTGTYSIQCADKCKDTPCKHLWGRHMRERMGVGRCGKPNWSYVPRGNDRNRISHVAKCGKCMVASWTMWQDEGTQGHYLQPVCGWSTQRAHNYILGQHRLPVAAG